MSPITSTEPWAHQGLPSTRLQLSPSSPNPRDLWAHLLRIWPQGQPLPFKSSSGCGYLALFRLVAN